MHINTPTCDRPTILRHTSLYNKYRMRKGCKEFFLIGVPRKKNSRWNTQRTDSSCGAIQATNCNVMND